MMMTRRIRRRIDVGVCCSVRLHQARRGHCLSQDSSSTEKFQSFSSKPGCAHENTRETAPGSVCLQHCETYLSTSVVPVAFHDIGLGLFLEQVRSINPQYLHSALQALCMIINV